MECLRENYIMVLEYEVAQYLKVQVDDVVGVVCDIGFISIHAQLDL